MSKNAFWVTVIIVAAIVGALLGPALARSLSPGAMLIFSVVTLVAIVGLVVWSLSANKSGKNAGTEALADARAMRAPEGKARIYVTRRGFVAALQGMNIALDDSASGQIKSGQMLMADVAPGVHRLHAAMAKGIMARTGAMEIEVGAGDVVVIDAMFEMSALKGDAKLTRLDGAKARENVHATKLVLWEVAPS
ncbi:hypothetical protein [Sphingopyxis sp. H115]|uniref:hypothetical protein n=1 Tax=Sphingopyxis sp. H115 TaxID=1759073 RepID=UPI000736BA2F|nr:hypothetical protein [Sphingopyxis sp. H115]KTE17631.1 hypothetical protein ATE71_00465 [Sphingopyxis sp. H115]